MASLWQLPAVYVLENNGYGEYTPPDKSTAGTGPARAKAMKIPAVTVDGNDIFQVYQAAKWAVDHARQGQGPAFVECKTYRWRGHHMGDQGDTYGYRSQAEIDEWMAKCPIRRLKEQLLATETTTSAVLEKIEAEEEQLIQAAVKFAKQAPYPDMAEVYTDVYA